MARLRAFVAQGGSIETLQPLLPTCVLVAPETFHAWQPGFDLDASLASKTVQDSQAVSAADRAGLREGDRLRGCSIRFNDPDTPVERHIENREAPIQFLPRGASTRIMQWPATDAACPLLAP